jgi:type III restriction enzyme
MSCLYQVLTQRVDAWRTANYPCDGSPAIREILEFATEDGEAAQLRYLRRAQFRALKTYWYLRLVLETPRIQTSTPNCSQARRIAAKQWD